MPEPGGYSIVHPKTYVYFEGVADCSEGVIEIAYSYMCKNIGQLKHANGGAAWTQTAKKSDHTSMQWVKSDGIFSWNMEFLYSPDVFCIKVGVTFTPCILIFFWLFGVVFSALLVSCCIHRKLTYDIGLCKNIPAALYEEHLHKNLDEHHATGRESFTVLSNYDERNVKLKELC